VTATVAPPPSPSPPAPSVPSRAVRAGDVLRSEWTKFRAVRSTYWTLLIAAGTGIGLSIVVAFAFAHQPSGPQTQFDPLLPGFASLEYAVLAIGVLGALTFTSEYSTGLIRTTLAAVPRRRALLAAKAAVTGAVALVTGEVVAFASFLADQAILNGSHLGVSLSHPGVPGAVLADGLLLFVCAMTGLSLGAIIRHTAGSVAAVVGVIYLPAVLGFLPPPWNDRIVRFTLISAAQQVTALHPSTTLFAPAISLIVLLAWPAAGLTAAAVLITRWDA
jgi:ABC-2 type transport system permease protein